MKKKRFISVLLTGIMAGMLILGGCGKKEDAPASGETKGQEESGDKEDGAKKYKIGFANASASNSWRVKMRDMLMEKADELGVEIVETNANDDANTMNSNIETMLQQDLDAILITPCVEDACNPGIEAAYAAGIPVIIFDRTCTTEDYTHFVGWPDVNNGEACAQMIVDYLTEKNGEPKGNIVALDSIAGSGTDNGQKEGQNKVFEKYPDVKIIDRQYSDFEAQKGMSIMEDWLSKYDKGEIDAVISQDGIVTLAAYEVVKDADRSEIVFVNADGVNGVCQMIKDGAAYGLTQFPCAVSQAALELAIQSIEGSDPSEKDVAKDAIKVTAENVDEYLIPDGDAEDWTY